MKNMLPSQLLSVTLSKLLVYLQSVRSQAAGPVVIKVYLDAISPAVAVNAH